MEAFLALVTDNPLFAFTVLLLVTLTIPPIFERLRLPGLVGLLLAGVILGPNVIDLLHPNGEVEKLLSDIGKIYLMFVAGLEIDLREFSQTRNRSLGFGFATFIVPLIVGIVLGRLFDYGWVGAILIGSLLASHTLLGYPVVMRAGVTKEESVTVTVGATIFTDIAALLVLAMCVAAQGGEFSAMLLIRQLLMLAAYAMAVLVGLNRIGKSYFRRTGDDQGNQFLFVLLAVFLAAVSSQLVNVENIVGAFLAGLAVNGVVGEGPVKEKVEFVGSVLFIPFFFVCMGLFVDIPVFLQALTINLGFTLSLVGALIGSKFLAALAAKLLYRYSWPQTLIMWSLSLPQVAATLAAALVGLQAGIISNRVFNAVIVLMLVTSVMGPVLTGRFVGRLPPSQRLGRSEGSIPPEELTDLPELAEPETPFTVVVPVYNPGTERYLIEMAALLANYERGRVVPLTVVRSHIHMDEPQLAIALDRGRRLLKNAEALGRELHTPVMPLLRLDDDVAGGISRAAREQDASLIVMGWSPNQGLRAKLFGTLIDSVFWVAHCPVAVTQLLTEPRDIHRILVPIKSLTSQALRAVRFAQIFAATHAAQVTLLHVSDRYTPIEYTQQIEADLDQMIRVGHGLPGEVKVVSSDDPAQVILEMAHHYDMVVLRSVRRRTAGGLAVSDVTHRVIADIPCSLVLFGEPHT